MSDKSIISFVGRLFGFGGRTATGTTEYVCPKGHPMDPSWPSCPRCEAESRAQEKSSLDIGKASINVNLSEDQPMKHDSTMVTGDAPRPGPHGTQFDPGDTGAQSQRRSAPRRKITGVLVSFTWERQGDLFVLYEGRNVIGRGAVESEGGRPCDVLLDADSTMSNEHAVILCRAGRYELFDRQSMNGTFVDGRFVESNGVELKDGAKIKTGATIWQIRMIESEPGGVPEPRHRDEPDYPRDDRPSDDGPNVRDPSRVR